MLYMLKNISYYTFVLIFTLFSNMADADQTDTQEVYLANEPLPKIAARLKNKGMTQIEIIQHLKNTLPKISPEVAKEKFNITWIDNIQLQENHLQKIEYMFKNAKQMISEYEKADKTTVDFNNPAVTLKHVKSKYENKPYLPHIYPALVVCYMGEEVGYGLFTLEYIETGDVVIEYTGENQQSDVGYYAFAFSTPEGKFGVIDAGRAGNAARFAQSLVHAEDLCAYKNTIIHGGSLRDYNIGGCLSPELEQDDIATANLNVICICDAKGDQFNYPQDSCGKSPMPRLMLVATKNIMPFEQLGFFYYDMAERVLKKLYFFDKNGDLVSYDDYKKCWLGSGDC